MGVPDCIGYSDGGAPLRHQLLISDTRSVFGSRNPENKHVLSLMGLAPGMFDHIPLSWVSFYCIGFPATNPLTIYGFFRSILSLLCILVGTCAGCAPRPRRMSFTAPVPSNCLDTISWWTRTWFRERPMSMAIVCSMFSALPDSEPEGHGGSKVPWVLGQEW